MSVKENQKNLRKIIKKNLKKVKFSEPSETQNNFKEGTNLENEPENIKELIHLEQNLKNTFKKSFSQQSEKKLKNLKKDEYEDEDENNIKKLQEKDYSPAKLEKIIDIKNSLKSNYRKRVIHDKHSAEEKVKHFEPILEGLSKVESSVNDVKEVAIKTDQDIQKMLIPTTPYKPRNPEVLRLLNTENYETPKSSPRKTAINSPMPPNIIIGENAQKYLPTLDPNNSFGIHFKENIGHMIGKCPIMFDFDDIILNGKKHILTPGMWRLLTHSDVTKPEFYTTEDYQNYVKILIETDAIYQNNDKSTGKPKSSKGDKYIKMISPIWKKMNSNKTPTIPKENLNPTIPSTEILKPTKATENKGAGLMNYTNNEIEFHWIDNMKQLNERCHLMAAEEKAGNYGFHNEKLGILKLFKIKMEHLIDDRKGIEYLLQYVNNLPNETTNDIEHNIRQLREKIYFISSEERAGNNYYHDDKLEILNFCIKKMEKVIDIPDKGPIYLWSFISSLPKKIIKGAGFFNDFLNCKFLPPMHYPKYNYLGPFTNLEKNEEQNIQPINKLDEAAREHDYFYKNHKDIKSRHIADKILEQKALERCNDPDCSMSEKIPAILTAYAMKGKRRLGMNLICE